MSKETGISRRAVVLGAGVLGLEVACGLARRGVRVTIVHPKATMMERQLDATAGSALTATLRELAIEVRPGIAARGDSRAAGLARIDAQMLLLHALGRRTDDRAWLVAHDGDALTGPQAQTFDALCRRRAEGEPVAYLTGHKALCHL
mgnify:CR=1 FL=1